MLTLYGIPNCDTVKKARRWLDGQGVAYRFHDFRRDGLTAAQVAAWAERLGWETLLNRRGTTWRRLPESAREDLDAKTAVALMTEEPTLIKRPVLDGEGVLHVGFSPADYERLIG